MKYSAPLWGILKFLHGLGVQRVYEMLSKKFNSTFSCSDEEIDVDDDAAPVAAPVSPAAAPAPPAAAPVPPAPVSPVKPMIY